MNARTVTRNEGPEVKFEKTVIQEARNILKGLNCVKGEKKGSITRSFVRNLLEISMQAKTSDEFEIRMDYIIARQEPRSGDHTLEFRMRFKDSFKKIKQQYSNYDELDIIRKMMEYIVMLHTTKSNITE